MEHDPEHLPADVYEAASRVDSYELLHRQIGELADVIHRTADLVFCSEELDETEFFRLSRQVKTSSSATQENIVNILGSLIFDDATSLEEKLLQAHDLVYEDWMFRRATFTEALGEPLDDNEPGIGEEAEYKEEAFDDFKLFHGHNGDTVDLSTLYTDILTDYSRDTDCDIKLFIGTLFFELDDEDYESRPGQQANDIRELPEQ